MSEQRLPALDGIRALAILLVVPHNTMLVEGVPLHGLGYPLKELLLFGWAGVQLFFVLSGFLITGALLDTQNAPNYYRAFYARRALRILPLYYGVLIVCFLILAPLQLLPAETLAEQHRQIWLWTFLSNWTDSTVGGVHGFEQYWSLAVEEQFYLLWPLIVRRLPPRRVLYLGFGIAIAALAIRATLRLENDSPDYLYEFTICRMDALALGAAAAAWMRIPEWRAATTRSLPYLPWAALVIWAIGAVLTRDYARTGFATQTFGQSLLAIIFTLAVVAAARPPGESSSLYVRVLSWAPLRSVGKYSFAMYVVHFPLNKWLGYPLATALVPHPGAFAAIVYGTVMVLLSYLIAWASFHLYEQHFLRLKKYFSAHGDARTATA